MNQVEERFVFEGTLEEVALRCFTVGLFRAVTHVRRTMVTQILGLGESGASHKFGAFGRSLASETADEDMEARRNSCSCWFADQGTDLQIGDCPNYEHGGLPGLIKRLVSGDQTFGEEAARDGYFFPNAVTLPEALHAMFGLLKDSLQTSEAWKNFEPILSEITVCMGNKMIRDRLLAVCMDAAEKWERQQVHHFSGHRFDWRWELLERILEQLVKLWPILTKYTNIEKMSKSGELSGVRMDHLARSIANKDDDLPGMEAMINASHVVTESVGINARWLKGCDCHAHILEGSHSPQKQKELMVAAGCDEGFCCLQGRRIVALIHGGFDTCKQRVRDANSPRLQEVLTASSHTVRTVTIEFMNHAKASWVDGFCDKFGFILIAPFLFAGLLGEFFGFSRENCVDVGVRLLDYWSQNQHNRKVHRLTVYFFSCEVFVKELRAFTSLSAGPRPEIYQLPNLFMFSLRIALLTLVGHYLERRHRGIKLQLASGADNTMPDLQSF